MTRILVIVGILLIVFGIFSLGTQGVTFFTQEKVAEVGPLEFNVQKPHTIWFHPATGGVALAVGLALVVVGAMSHKGRV